MGQKTFLNAEQWTQAEKVVMPPLMTPDGDVLQVSCFSSANFSLWLGDRLEEVFKSHNEWRECHPIIMGSWARGELCPKSDIDVLFCGAEEKVKTFVEHLQEQGLRIRYRMPQNPENWAEGVQAFDILALLKAQPWTAEGAKKLYDQQRQIWNSKNKLRMGLLKAIKTERKAREKRYDSITNYLEPNLKYGPGGLRDLEQGLQIYELFAEKFTNPAYALNVLRYYRSYFIALRQKLHMEGHGDILSGSVQFDIARWLGFKTHKDFMRDLQRGLSRVSFYSDWIVNVAESSAEQIHKSERVKFKKFEDFVSALNKDSRMLVQKKVRENLDVLLPEKRLKSLARRRGQTLQKILDVKASDELLVSVFRSRLIDKLVSEVRRLVGYVQHDQYHRFTSDSHIMQACREVKRVYKKNSSLGILKFLASGLSQQDWKILTWTAMYHDLAKGLEEGDRHALRGVKIVEKDFRSYGFAKTFTEEVSWMVQNHLELSQAAFRRNPRDVKVWQELQDKGITGDRLIRLALFTVIDIRATNPEAWTEWKAKLLKDLVLHLQSQRARSFFDFSKLKKRAKLHLDSEIIEELDIQLLEGVPLDTLVKDLKLAEVSDTSLKPLLLKNRKGELWIRLHEKQDRRGVLSDFVGQLYSLGLRIRNASIHTIPKVGVYDWFQITSSRNVAILSKMLENASFEKKDGPEVRFDSIHVISADEEEWVMSFKAVDQPGLLVAAAKALSDCGASIKSAHVHTWGRQVDDVFYIKVSGSSNELLQNLSTKLYCLDWGS